MDPITIATAIGASVLLFFIIAVGLTYRTRYRARRYALLKDSLNRLKTVVAELLEKVNDCDQHIKYFPNQDMSVAESRLKVAASDLVTVVDCIPTVEALLNERRLNDAGDMLSASTRLIEKVVRVLAQVEPALLEKYTESGGKLKLETSKDNKIKLTDKKGKKSN